MEKISYKGYRFPPEVIKQAIWQSVGCSYLSGLECSNCRGP